MATRSRIGIVLEDGTITSTYCHWDGYPSGVGKILKEHYTNPTKILELIAIADLSSLGAEVHPTPGLEHTFRDPQENVTVSYSRDRGDTDCAPMYHKNVRAFTKDCRDCDAEYGYVFKDGKWKTYKTITFP